MFRIVRIVSIGLLFLAVSNTGAAFVLCGTSTTSNSDPFERLVTAFEDIRHRVDSEAWVDECTTLVNRFVGVANSMKGSLIYLLTREPLFSKRIACASGECNMREDERKILVFLGL